jgi:2,3-bisphosphoglycerate-independent phosphoglycerate mutase
MQTLYADMPRESMVAQLGMLGWNPKTYYPCGRASAELLATHGIDLRPNDIAFRANFVRMKGPVLESYSANSINSSEAHSLAFSLSSSLAKDFPEFALYHNSEFRNTLIFQNACVDPRVLICPEPHECQGRHFSLPRLISSVTASGAPVAERINRYVAAAAETLNDGRANAIFPWSASRALRLPPFSQITGITGPAAIVGYMDFLRGIAIAGGLEFYQKGNGRPDTDYRGKGDAVIELLDKGYSFVTCHINGPDEASHMRDLNAKIDSLEQIDRWIVSPVLSYFQKHLDEIGGLIIVPDHYSNIGLVEGKRSDSHSLHSVPFAFWNNCDRDPCTEFHEDDVVRGKYRKGISHLDLLSLLFGLQ